MINWLDVIKYARKGNLTPPRRVIKSEEEWKAQLTDEEFRITRKKGTERAGTGAYCESLEPALYGCKCCDTWLFDSREKFESGTGWPSFTQPVAPNVIKYEEDNSYGMKRVEVMCNVCDAHLGHVFPDGPMPSGLRYCINSASLRKVETDNLKMATFGGGCFWCTEVIFQSLNGVEKVTSGYSGGSVHNPTYEDVTTGRTGHAEVIQIIFDESIISYEDLVRIHLHTHNPTTLNRQGADVGTQYRSAIFTHDEKQAEVAQQILEEEKGSFSDAIVTEVTPFDTFYPAESYHQNFYKRNPNHGYCNVVITPKLQKLRSKYSDKLKQGEQASAN